MSRLPQKKLVTNCCNIDACCAASTVSYACCLPGCTTTTEGRLAGLAIEASSTWLAIVASPGRPFKAVGVNAGYQRRRVRPGRPEGALPTNSHASERQRPHTS